ncbi:Thermosome subunit [Operophtera brumata]|uniref:Thermosome subunit n=1 Tax=Operophtera brumata TaxID=104452 RepID=A0A0L7LD55_OPEBR|nr:Thermosome subunit [Operophtera brumata]
MVSKQDSGIAFLSSVHSVVHLCGKILKCPSPETYCASEAITAWKSLCPNDNVPQEENQEKQWDAPLELVTNKTRAPIRTEKCPESLEDKQDMSHSLQLNRDKWPRPFRRRDDGAGPQCPPTANYSTAFVGVSILT